MLETRRRQLGVVCEIRGAKQEWVRVQLYDCHGQCLCERCGPSSCTQWLTVEAQGEYEIRVSVCPFRGINLRSAHRWVCLSPSESTLQYFVFTRHPFGCVPVRFLLKDAAYPDMPIEGGTLSLWPSML